MQGNYAVANLGTASANLATFSNASNRAWARADLATTVPDFAVVALGTNNIGAAYTVNITAYVQLFQLIKGMGIKRIFVSTLIPRTDAASLAGTVTADMAAGATSFTSSISIPNGTPIQIGWGRKLDRVTTNGAPTGTGPYTIPIPATTLAHTSGEQVISGLEMSRQGINDWLRQVPGDVLGCLDFDLVMAFGIGSSKPDPRCMSNDGVHPLRSGYQRMGQLAAPLGVTL
jgi:lysophospholipase L1-like esterase